MTKLLKVVVKWVYCYMIYRFWIQFLTQHQSINQSINESIIYFFIPGITKTTMMSHHLLVLGLTLLVTLATVTGQHAHFSTGWTPGLGVGWRSSTPPLDGEDTDSSKMQCGIRGPALRKIMAVVFVSTKLCCHA